MGEKTILKEKGAEKASRVKNENKNADSVESFHFSFLSKILICLKSQQTLFTFKTSVLICGRIHPRVLVEIASFIIFLSIGLILITQKNLK